MLAEGQAVIVLLREGPVRVSVENPDCWGPSFSISRSMTFPRLGDPFTFDYTDEGITWTADTSPAGVDALCAAAKLTDSTAPADTTALSDTAFILAGRAYLNRP